MNEFEETWNRFLPITEGQPVREVCELFYLKGINEGREAVLKELRPLVNTSLTSPTALSLREHPFEVGQ